MNRIAFIFSFLLIAFACNQHKITEQERLAQFYKQKGKQLNITILLDLSDRLDTTKYPAHPPHYKRDLELIRVITEIFKADMQRKGAFMAKEKIRVIFSPMPNDDEISSIIKTLDIDLSKFSVEQTREKQKIYDTITQLYESQLSRIYHRVMTEKNYIGADIWHFFQNDVRDFAIERDTNYRNILIILTDGYLYHPNCIMQKGNRTSYIGIKMLSKLRGQNWLEKFERGDYGIINPLQPDEKLDNLEVLVLELTSNPAYPNDIDILKAYWRKWLSEMGVKHFQVYVSEVPALTEKRLHAFFGI